MKTLLKKTAAIAVSCAMLLGCISAIAENSGFAEETADIVFTVFHDENNNGIKGKYEDPVKDVHVAAYIAAGEKMELEAEGTSDSKGNVTFKSLPVGTYYFKAQLPENYGFSSNGGTVSKDSSIFDFALSGEGTSSGIAVDQGMWEMGIGVIKYSTFSGSCFMDENLDGIWQEDEEMLPGVTVQLLTRPKKEVAGEAVSDENGEYTVKYVKPGDYILSATLPDGVAFTKYSKEGRERRSIITTAGESTATRDVKVLIRGTTDQNIGGTYSAVVKGKCFKDNIYNGIYDSMEEGLAGVKVELIKSNGEVCSTAVSDDNGEFEFDSLRNGTYRVQVTLPAGYVYTMTSAEEGGNLFSSRNFRRDTTLSGFQVAYPQKSEIIIGAIHLGTVSGKAYFDDDYSGKMDGDEKPAAGINVVLTDDDGNTVASAKTNQAGEYSFEMLNPGTYTVSATAKSGYAFTKPGDGSVIENGTLGKGKSAPFELAMGDDRTGMDMGMVVPAKVSGTVFDDENENGTMDSSEVGLVGTRVSLLNEEGEAASCTIGEDGKFAFDAVMPGRYSVRYELVGNSFFTKIPEGGKADAELNDIESAEIEVSAGEHREMEDCGGVVLYELEGAFFQDTNGNGIKDSGEKPLSGVELVLQHGEADVERQTTDEEGKFRYESMHPGEYTFSYKLPDGYYTTRNDDSQLAFTRDTNSQAIEFTADRKHIYSFIDTGAAQQVTVEGKIWIDENRDGRLDVDEYTPENESVTLVDCYCGEAVMEIKTDKNGIFSACDITPGVYTLVYTADDDTSAAVKGDSTFIAGENGTFVMENISVGSGEYFRDANLGIVRTGTVAGKVWIDKNGEILPVEGAVVTISSGEEATTSEDGTYSFRKLEAGEYEVNVMLPEGMVYVEQGDSRLTSGENVSIVTSYTGREGKSGVFRLRMGERKAKSDIGAVMSASLGDTVWLDENNDGLQGDGEIGVPGVTLTLYRVGLDEPVGSVTTDPFGYYCFKDLYPAEYVIKAEYPTEVKPTIINNQVPLINSVLQEDGTTLPLALVSGARNYNADLGFALVKKGVYPQDYGSIPTQDWTDLGSSDEK